jgi:Derlin-2/3
MAEDGPEAWYRSWPPVTRGYLTAAFASTVVVQLDLVNPLLLYLDFGLVLSKLELWRLLTNFCFFGGFSMPFVFSMFFLVRYGKELETKRFAARCADFIWCLAFCGLVQLAIAYCIGQQPFLASSMLSAIVYLWSREYAEQTLSMFGLFNVQGFYFPWVLCAIRVLMGGSATPDLIGIFAGHVYYFLVDVQGYAMRAPLILSDALDTPATGPARAAQQNRNAFGGHQWGGGGQRLGTG